MAKARLDINIRPNTSDENKDILNKLRARGKVDGRSHEELLKLFKKLNAKNADKESKISKGQFGSRPDQLGRESVCYGPIEGFPSGSWWGIRMDCARDQVHCPFNEDIQIGPFGAASICTSHLNIHKDIDFGDYLTFTSSEYEKDTLQNHPMIKSFQKNIPIRVIRSYNLTNEFAPKTGYRYDGIYVILSYWIGLSTNSSKRYIKFSLARIQNQEPAVWQIHLDKVDENSTSKRTRTKLRLSGSRCHMDCCKDSKVSNDKSSSNFSSLVIGKLEKNVQESTIVMRHVSKKNEGSMMAGVESPVQNNKILASSGGIKTCKLQNTNLSIRTDLYDSSSDLLIDNKKPTPMTFCRIFKAPSARVAAVEIGNLNERKEDDDKEKVEEEGIKLRSGVKNNVKRELSSSRRISGDKKQTKVDLSRVVNGQRQTRHEKNIKTLDKAKKACENLKNTDKKLSEDLTNSEELLEDNLDSASVESMINQNRLSDALASVEKLSPEEMVKLIVKERDKRTGKLLIGNIIGDINLINDSLSSPKSSSTKPETIVNKKNNENVNKYFDKKQSTGNKIVNENKQERPMKLMHLRRTRISKALAPIEDINIQNNHQASSSATSTTTTTTASKRQKNSSQKPFSKSIGLKIKKRKGELANLVIDANFTTKIRGTKTRSLGRYPTRLYSKKRDNLYFKTRQKVDLLKKSKNYGVKKPPTISKHHPELTKKLPNINKAIDTTRTNVKRIKSLSDNNNVSSRNIELVKPKMVDAMTQCSLKKDASTLVDGETQSSYNDHEAVVKIESIDLDDVKSETYESDNDSLQEVIYRHPDISTFPREPRKNIIRPNCVKNNSTGLRLTNNHGLSAFAPVVNLSDIDFRIARLRSIGFKPIDPCLLNENNEKSQSMFTNYQQNDNSNESTTSTIVKKNVDAQFNKYTSEENNIVEYMDDELRYQDIEDEEGESNGTKMFIGMLKKRKIAADNYINNKQDNTDNDSSKKIVAKAKKRRCSSSIEEHEVSWHDWKKFIAKEGTVII